VSWNLAKKHKRVLFIEPPFTIFSPLKTFLSWKQLLNFGKLKQRSENLYTYSPWKIFPASLPPNGIIDWDGLSRKIIMNAIRSITKKLMMNKPVLWVYFSEHQYDYYGEFDEVAVVVDWHDKFATDSSCPISIDWVIKAIEQKKRKEEKLIAKADIIFTVSRPLLHELEHKHKNVYLVSNGVDFEHFDNYTNESLCNLSLEKIKKPILIFLGMMHYKVDFKLLDYIAETHPEMTLMLIGNKNINYEEDIKQFDVLVKRKNVIYIGRIEKEEIPRYLNIADVCLLPMKNIEFNKYANCLKLWEYLAAGKPVVATNHGVDYNGEELIYIAKDRNEYLKLIAKALEDGHKHELIEKRKQFAKENSWDKKVDLMLQILDRYLKDKGI
jgi:glycosyltransferase involved in cell wall biosynthesis